MLPVSLLEAYASDTGVKVKTQRKSGACIPILERVPFWGSRGCGKELYASHFTPFVSALRHTSDS